MERRKLRGLVRRETARCFASATSSKNPAPLPRRKRRRGEQLKRPCLFATAFSLGGTCFRRSHLFFVGSWRRSRCCCCRRCRFGCRCGRRGFLLCLRLCRRFRQSRVYLRRFHRVNAVIIVVRFREFCLVHQKRIEPLAPAQFINLVHLDRFEWANLDANL